MQGCQGIRKIHPHPPGRSKGRFKTRQGKHSAQHVAAGKHPVSHSLFYNVFIQQALSTYHGLKQGFLTLALLTFGEHSPLLRVGRATVPGTAKCLATSSIQ